MNGDSLDSKLLRVGQGYTPWKGACRVAATTNLALSGLPVVDGVQLVAGDRVLCAGQTDPKMNGVYAAKDGAWSRSLDLSVNPYWWFGSAVMVTAGTVYAGSMWTLTSPNTGRVELGISALTFSVVVAGEAQITALAANVDELIAQVVAAEEAVETFSEQVDDFEARVAELEATVPPAWTIRDTIGLIFWGKGIQDALYRTMTGTRCDALLNPLGTGLDMVRTTGTPTIIASGGRNVFRSAGTSDMSCATGGPIGNEAFWIKVLTLGDDTTFGEFIRVGARSNLASPDPACGVGVTVGAEFGGGRLAAEGVPRGAQPGSIANGQARSVTVQYLPAYGKLIVKIDGRAPQATSGSTWAYSKTYVLDGSFALGATVAAATANTSGLLDFVVGRGILSAIDESRIDDAWCKQFAEVTRLPGEIVWVGDSITNGDDLVSPSTEAFRIQVVNAVNAAVVNPIVGQKNSLGGKRGGGAWLQGSPPGTFQSSGQYQVFVDVSDQGIHYTLPFQRSGRRRLQISSHMFGTNDIVSDDITAADMIGRLKAEAYSAHAAGYFTMIWSTIIGSASFWTAPKEAKRQAVIAWIRDQSEAEGFNDIPINSEDAGLGWPGDFVAIMPEGNVHPNLAGHTKLAVLGTQKVLEFLQRWEAAGSPAIRPPRGLAA